MRDLSIGNSEPLNIPDVHITELTAAKIRIFLAEIAEGVSNYRSLHSLTQQVEHQYHGRFLIELIQNAHDAFSGHPGQNSQNRIEITFDSTDSEYGSLLVANDGLPFSKSNFERLSQLGQSDKNPENSIGNKGIGFRSVLEISNCPAIYSQLNTSSKSFDGYCFGFNPGVVAALVNPIVSLAIEESIPCSPLSGRPIVDWSNDQLTKYKMRVQAHDENWLLEETKFLSPYLLPVSVAQSKNAAIKAFEARGFATVIRLPLKSNELRDKVIDGMKQISSSTILFLEKISSLKIEIIDEWKNNFYRKEIHLEGDPTGRKVIISDGEDRVLEYALWKTCLHVANAPAPFLKAVQALPGRWPDIREINVSAAVRLGDTPDIGKFSIFLPTLVETGSATHVNAPFFGDMSRTSIPFDDAYNNHLLQIAGDLVLDVVRSRLSGRDELHAKAIVDFLAPFGRNTSAKLLWEDLLIASAERANITIAQEPLMLARHGWEALNVTSLLPRFPRATVVTEERLHQHATFNVFHECLNSRREQLKALAISQFGDVGVFPLADDLARTIAAIAVEIHTNGGDWNAFWIDVEQLLPKDQNILAQYEVLLGADDRLHKADSGTIVFFTPRQGTPDASDVDASNLTIDVPITLQPHVAFLNEKIQMYDSNRLSVQTPIRIYLAGGLVSQFRIETVFTNVLQKLTPPLPVPIDGVEMHICQAIMSWGLRLMASILFKGKEATTMIRLLRQLPVPCEGGWFPMELSSFGEGWPETSGALLKSYIDLLTPSTASNASARLLLPPDHSTWNQLGISNQRLLLLGGVIDGLRLQAVTPNSWRSEVQASSANFQLPSKPPSNMNVEQWTLYCSSINPNLHCPYVRTMTYVVNTFYIFPGFSEIETFSEKVRISLCELILQSIPNWSAGLADLVITKENGLDHRVNVISPLKFFLKTVPWLGLDEFKSITWSIPSERWYVPGAVLSGRAKHFAHLNALPSAVAKRIDRSVELREMLRSLGMPFFDLQTETQDPSLILALTDSVGSEDVGDQNILLGQIREAWHVFRPSINFAALNELVVRRSNKQLDVIVPTIAAPVYFPDFGGYVSELEQFGIPVMAIETSDAKALREWFNVAYGPRVQLTSELTLEPQTDGSKWIGNTALPLLESELGWLKSPLLTLVAFHGQMRGVHSAAFQERVSLFADVRVDFVDEISIAVMRANDIIFTTKVPAFWDVKRKTIIVGSECNDSPNKLSGVLSQAMQRDDLELPIRYILSSVNTIEQTGQIANFLAPLRISDEQIQQVTEHLRGDIGHIVSLLRVLVAVLSPTANQTEFLASTTEVEIEACLIKLNIPNFDIHRILRIAKDSHDMFNFGWAMSRHFGEIVELPQWNKVLNRFGHVELKNKIWVIQFHSILDEVAGIFKRVIAHLISKNILLVSFSTVLKSYEDLYNQFDLSFFSWEISFQIAMDKVADLTKSWNGSDVIVSSVRTSISIENLRERLSLSGVDMDLDPDECSRKNYQLVDSVANQIENIRLAWSLKNLNNEQQKTWSHDIEKYHAVAEPSLLKDGFTRFWCDADVLIIFRDLNTSSTPEFWDVFFETKDVEKFRIDLNLSLSEIAGAAGQLIDIKVETNRRRSIVNVCGIDFDSTEQNLGKLWDVLISGMPDELIAANAALDLNKSSDLKNQSVSKKKPSGDGLREKLKKQPRQVKSVDELVGLAGEIFVFRMLQQKYGIDVVSSSAWISENSRHVFKYNSADDSQGCDFSFSFKGKSFKVEVKSSSGDDETFKLGSSEIRLAMALGNNSKRKREIFVLVHVKNALSNKPSAVVLPNPYDAKFSGFFRIEEADARVRYQCEI